MLNSFKAMVREHGTTGLRRTIEMFGSSLNPNIGSAER
jgi:hypothetical protein